MWSADTADVLLRRIQGKNVGFDSFKYSFREAKHPKNWTKMFQCLTFKLNMNITDNTKYLILKYQV